MDWKAIFEQFKNLKVIVIGDVMIDAYVYGRVNRISPEAPVPVVNVTHTEKRLGGAGNVALNVKALGATPILVSAIGDDDEGSMLMSLMDDKMLRTDGLIAMKNRVTTVKQRVLSGSQHLLRIDNEQTNEISIEEENKIFSIVKRNLKNIDTIIFEDYDKGSLTESLIQKVIHLANSHGIPTVVDPKKKHFLSYKGCSLFKPNLKELKEGLQIDIDDKDQQQIIEMLFKLQEIMPVSMALVTLSEKGVLATDYRSTFHYPAHRREISDVSGAGDTVISVAALALASDLALADVAKVANLAGGLVCEHLGVVPIDTLRLLTEAERLYS